MLSMKMYVYTQAPTIIALLAYTASRFQALNVAKKMKKKGMKEGDENTYIARGFVSVVMFEIKFS